MSEPSEECRTCGFVGCICHRGERDPFPESAGGGEDGAAPSAPRARAARDKGPGPKVPVRAADPMLDALKKVADRAAGSKPRKDKSMQTETRAKERKPKQEPAGKKSGPGSRSVVLPAEEVHAFFREKGFTEDSFGGEIIYTRGHDRCKHLTVTIYTSLPMRGGDTRAVGEDAIRVTAVFKKETPGRERPYVKVVFKSPRVYRTGTVEGCLERAIERAREAYDVCNRFLKTDKCFACEAKRSAR